MPDTPKKKMRNPRMAQDEAANEAAIPSKMPTVTAPDPMGDLDTDGSLTARKMRAVPKELPADRDAGPKKPADYKEAAAVLRSDKALMAKYHAGVASGKAFSMVIGGKTFKYAATAQPGAKKTPSAQPSGGKQPGDEDFTEVSPKTSAKEPTTVENSSPALRKIGMPGLEDYARGPRGARSTDNGGRVQRTKAETDDAWRKYAGVDPREYDDQKGLPSGNIAKDVESRSSRMTKEQGLMQSYLSMSPAQRGSRAGEKTYNDYLSVSEGRDALKDVARKGRKPDAVDNEELRGRVGFRDVPKKKMKASSKKG